MRSRLAIGAAIAALGALVALIGDANHVATGTTRYEWHGLPTVWRSVLWFPFLVAAGVLGQAVLGRDQGAPVRRERRPVHVVIAAVLVLGLYLLTGLWRDVPWGLALVVTTVPALGIWWWWDPSAVAFLNGLVSAVVGPLAEALLVALGAASYASDSDQLLGVAPWLAPLYFAAGAVASGLWRPLQR